MKCTLLLAAACLGCLVSTHALAWNQTMTCDNKEIPCNGNAPMPVHWITPCISYYLNENGTNQMKLADVQTVVKKSINAWNQPKRSSLQLHYSGFTNEDRVGYNPYTSLNANIIVFRDSKWTESKSIMALTSVTHNAVTGEIYDADIEVNTATYKFGIVEKAGKKVVDLENTLTHEIGHTFGLAHSTVNGATMSVYAANGETNLRTLENDDLSAIASIYPRNGLECHFADGYFTRPPYGMNERPSKEEEDCSAAISRPASAPMLVWFILLASLLGLRPIRRRL